MTIRVGSRIAAKLSITDYENVIVENSLELSEGSLKSTEDTDAAEVERSAKRIGLSIYRKDGSVSLIRLQRAVSELTKNEFRQYRKAIADLNEADELKL